MSKSSILAGQNCHLYHSSSWQLDNPVLGLAVGQFGFRFDRLSIPSPWLVLKNSLRRRWKTNCWRECSKTLLINISETLDNFADRSMPNDVLQHTTPATQLLEKRQELSEVEDALRSQKEVRWLLRVKASKVLKHVSPAASRTSSFGWIV